MRTQGWGDPARGSAAAPPPPPTAGSPSSAHLALRGTVVDRVLVYRAQVFQEPVRAQGPAHLDQEHREGVRPFSAFSALIPRPGSWGQAATRSSPTHLPASGAKALASAADGQGAFPHAREAGCPRPKRVAAEMGVRGRGGVVAGPPARTRALDTPDPALC